MFNLMLGAPGGGKSYEACVYHILPALNKGRKVITNLPLDVDRWRRLDPSFGELIELRTSLQPVRGSWDPGRPDGAFELFEDGHLEAQPVGARPFGSVWDYWSTWKHPDTGIGPLFVIDEAHLAMPAKDTDRQVEEWYSLHRHFNVDGLLITQSYGKLSAAVRDLVQVVYRVRKNIALGSTNSYTRKVQDGIRGEVVNTTIRRYEKRYFGLYRSHTQGGAADESNASDVRPIWKNWTFLGAAGCGVVLIGLLASGKVHAPWSTQKPAKVPTARAAASAPTDVAARVSSPTVASRAASAAARVAGAARPASAAGVPEPFSGRGLHLTGYMRAGAAGREVWTFSLSQNGQGFAAITDADLRAAGYTWRGFGQCAGVASWHGQERNVICDAPQITLRPGGNVPAPKAEGEPAPKA